MIVTRLMGVALIIYAAQLSVIQQQVDDTHATTHPILKSNLVISQLLNLPILVMITICDARNLPVGAEWAYGFRFF